MRGLIALLVAGCQPFEADESLIDELQVLALVAEPPEVGPGEHLRLTVHTMDPQRDEVDLLVWFCTDLGEGCAERGDPGQPLSSFAQVVRSAPAAAGLSFVVPPEVGYVLGGNVRVTTFVAWALACRPGACPLIEQVAADPAPGTETWEQVTAALAAPRDIVEGRGLTEASLAYRRLTLSIRSFEERNHNPILTFLGRLPLEVPTDSTVVLPFDVFDASRAWNYASTGGFSDDAYGVTTGALSASWTAPAQVGSVSMLVIVDDGVGGSAVWRTEARVLATE